MPEEPPTINSQAPRHDPFTTTRWSVVLAAGRHTRGDSRQALASLCVSYWVPLYAYVRRRVADPDEAEELTQAFFAELLEKDFVGSATPQRGRFRAFLLTALKHFLANQWKKARAQKRGGGRSPLSLDFTAVEARCHLEPSGGLTPEELYDRQWALTLLDQTLQRLETQCRQEGKGRQFALLRRFLTGDHAGTTYAAVARELNTTPDAAKMAAHRLRIRYRELLRTEIAGTLADPSEVDDEIRALFAVLEK